MQIETGVFLCITIGTLEVSSNFRGPLQAFRVSPSAYRIPGLPRVSPRFKCACQLGQRLQGPHGVRLVSELFLHRSAWPGGRSHLVGVQATGGFPHGVNYSVGDDRRQLPLLHKGHISVHCHLHLMNHDQYVWLTKDL